MPSRQQTIADAVQLFQRATYPTGLQPTSTWLGIYQTLLWYEPVNWLSITSLPHIIDADKLRPSSPAKQRNWTSPSVWQRRAQRVNDHLAHTLGCPPNAVQQMVDQLMKLPAYAGMQRQNTLGIVFAGLLQHILERFGSRAISYQTEVPADSVFAGIRFPGRSTIPSIDVLATRNSIPCAIISAKWSVRHDRLNDITNECPVYKSAYQRIFRQEGGRRALLYYVATNEYDPARLARMLDDDCIDGVVHVHKPAVVTVCGLDGRLNNLLDLSDLITAAKTW